ncbi:hypothetical protein K2X05_02085, partial [bacterium]|nr:hypothetical protein [bacterium]
GAYIIVVGIYIRFYHSKKTKRFYSAVPLGGTPWILIGLAISPIPFQWIYLIFLLFDADWWITAVGLPYALIQGQFRDKGPRSKL